MQALSGFLTFTDAPPSAKNIFCSECETHSPCLYYHLILVKIRLLLICHDIRAILAIGWTIFQILCTPAYLTNNQITVRFVLANHQQQALSFAIR
jgi:hypothetical protein